MYVYLGFSSHISVNLGNIFQQRFCRNSQQITKMSFPTAKCICDHHIIPTGFIYNLTVLLINTTTQL